MEVIATSHALLLAALLFAIGLAGLCARRNALFMLVSLEIMLNAAGLAFVAAGASHGQAAGSTMFVLILTLAAAEVSVGLALILQLRRLFGSIDADVPSTLSG
jgi:NADH-quinone oxidoreductase subunit K